jgi:hypothetical protein
MRDERGSNDGPVGAFAGSGAGILWDASLIAHLEAWRFKIPPALVDPTPLEAFAALDWATLARSDLVLDGAAEHAPFFARIADALKAGPGFAVLSRIPVESLSYRRARMLHVSLAKQFGRLRPQDEAGSYLCDVVDPDSPEDAESRDKALLGRRWNDLPCHTDHAFGREPPRLLAFLCFHAAASGGAVRLVSAATLIKKLAAASPDLIAALRRPVPFDRTRQLDADDQALEEVAILSTDEDGLRFRYLHHQIAHERLDPEQREAIAALEALLADERTVFALKLAPGDALLIDNRVILHGRGAYRNMQERREPRHHLRLWLT